MERRSDARRRASTPSPVPDRRLRELRPIIATLVSERTRTQVADDDLRLSRATMKVAYRLPSREEWASKTERDAPLYATLLVSCNPIPIPDPARFSTLPVPIPRPVQDRFAQLVAELVQDTGLWLTRREVSLIGENGKVALPNRRELERMQSSGAPIHGVLLISATPINTW